MVSSGIIPQEIADKVMIRTSNAAKIFERFIYAFLLEKVIDLIKQANSVVILSHDSEDADAVGSSFAMRLALLGMGKDAKCIFSEIPEERIRFLGEDYTVFDENVYFSKWVEYHEFLMRIVSFSTHNAFSFCKTIKKTGKYCGSDG